MARKRAAAPTYAWTALSLILIAVVLTVLAGGGSWWTVGIAALVGWMFYQGTLKA